MVLNALCGGSLGLLVGLLVGLSMSPIVGTVLGGLIAVITVFLTLRNDENLNLDPDNRNVKIQLIRLLSFSLIAVMAVVFGIFMRANNLIGISEIGREYSNLVAIGFLQKEARDIIKARIIKVPLANKNKANQSVVFGHQTSNENCRELDPSEYSNINNLLEKYSNSGDPWQKFAESVKKNVEKIDEQKIILLYLHKQACR